MFFFALLFAIFRCLCSLLLFFFFFLTFRVLHSASPLFVLCVCFVLSPRAAPAWLGKSRREAGGSVPGLPFLLGQLLPPLLLHQDHERNYRRGKQRVPSLTVHSTLYTVLSRARRNAESSAMHSGKLREQGGDQMPMMAHTPLFLPLPPPPSSLSAQSRLLSLLGLSTLFAGLWFVLPYGGDV